MKKITTGIIALTSLVASPFALAHAGHDHVHSSFFSGITHPLTGFDHLIMLLAIGVMAMNLKDTKKSVLMMATSAVIMLSGLMLGSQLASVAGIEALITGSLFIAAVSLWKQSRTNSSVAKTVLNTVSVAFILFHGWAHGVEFAGTSLATFGLGMAISSVVIMSVGFYTARFIPTKVLAPITAVCGVAVALA